MDSSANGKPWRQKEMLDPAFPCRLWDSAMRNGFASHWHEPLEMAYVSNGMIALEIDRQMFEINTGDIVVINSGVIHKYFKARHGSSLTIFQFGLNLFDQTLVELHDQGFQKLVFGRKPLITAEDGNIHSRLRDLLFTIRREYTGRDAGFRLAIRSALYALAMIFLRDIPAKPFTVGEQSQRAAGHQKLERVFAYIHDNARLPELTLEKTAEAAALSKFYFTRFFREQTGQTFHAYLSRMRVNMAEEYLSESDMPVTEIAYACGFGSPATFNRLFKTYTGVSPSAYRTGAKIPGKMVFEEPLLGQFLS